MTTFVPQLFVPYELIFLAGVSALFYIIYRYLSKSLDGKKEVLLGTITEKYDMMILNYESRLSPYLQDPRFRDRYYTAKRLLLSDERLDAKEVFEYFNSDTIRDRFQNRFDLDVLSALTNTLRLRKRSEQIQQDLPKFRLRDLEKIYKHPDTIEIIYNQRTRPKGSK